MEILTYDHPSDSVQTYIEIDSTGCMIMAKNYSDSSESVILDPAL